MSDATVSPLPPDAVTAGRLLREARQAQGLHIAALASAIKVTPRKLELLESDRFDELPDATFTRALAQTVCRSLKVDAAPILALLPRADRNRLGHLGEGLNAPFHERPGRFVPSDWANLARPAIWGPALVLAAAAAVYLLPPGLFGIVPLYRPPADPAASSASVAPLFAPAPGEAASNVAAPVDMPVKPAMVSAPGATLGASEAQAQPVAAVGAAPAAPADLAPKLLQVHVSADSWVEVVDGRGHALLSRLVKPGEVVDLDGAVPLKLRIGNASGTEVIFRGQPLALAPYTRDNLARLELK
jgi:cytoskeleton protein RodZ